MCDASFRNFPTGTLPLGAVKTHLPQVLTIPRETKLTMIMHPKNKLKYSLLAAAAALGLAVAVAASAQSANVAVPTPAPAEANAGLLGATYTGVEWNYISLTDGPPDSARGFTVNYNQPLSTGFDFNANYSWARASAFGVRATEQRVNVGVTAFNSNDWGKPFILAATGWAWDKAASVKQDSFTYTVGTGVEFAVVPSFTLTPFVNFVRATSFNTSEFDLGVKANYRLTKEWGLNARIQYDAVRHASDATEYALGVNYRF